MSPRRRRPQRRLAVLCVLLLLMFVTVIGRLGQLQVVGDARYVEFGEEQRVRNVTLSAQRGSIFDRSGNDLAVSIPQKTIWADPKLVGEPEATAQALAPVLGVPEDELVTDLTADSRFVYLRRRVPDAVSDKVAQLGLDGVHLLDEPTRFNPGGDLASSILGTVGVDNDGLSGLELQYDDVLSGDPGELVYERDPDGRTIAAAPRRIEPARRGHDLELTIDRSFQFEAERVLGEQIVETGAEGGYAIVSRPSTGEILAMANLRRDDETGEVSSAGSNGALVSVYEPGSVNKMITLAGALEDGIVTPETTIEVPDAMWVADHRFSDHDPHPTQHYSVTDILVQSLNIGTIKVAQMLGRDRVDHYLREFGFGSRTALGFPGESPGLMLEPRQWSGTSIGSIPIGQGVAVTAMQMLSAFNTIANDGHYQPPRLVQAEIDEHGDRHRIETADGRQVVSELTAARMRSMLAQVVDRGTGSRAALDGYSVAGKTGTARKPQPGGGYLDEAGNYRYVATFVGFAPAEHPELSIIVVIDEPSSTIFGGSASAPVFAELARYGLRHLQVPPTELVDEEDETGDPSPLARAEPAVGPTAGSGTGTSEPSSEPTTTTILRPDVVDGPD